MAFQDARRPRDAGEWFGRVVAVRPEFTSAQFNLALALQNQGRLEEALERYALVLTQQPTLAAACQNRALLLQMLGRHGEAAAVYRDGVRACPDNPDLPRYLVAAAFYDPTLSDAARFAMAEAYGTRIGGGSDSPRPSGGPEKRLRLGYVTSDFRDHPIARNVEPLLIHRDRDAFEVFVYADVAEPDAVTARLRDGVDAWRAIERLDDAAVAELARQDGIDILVVLAGHLDRNRPGIAAFRPAPVQVSFHDVTTSASRAYDYLIADRTVCPRRPAERFTERVVRLPGIYVHAPMDVPPSEPRPAAARVTFGCLNNPAKLNDVILALWGRVLAAVPGARLVLKYRSWFRAPDLQRRVLSTLAPHGVGPERIEFLGGEDTRAAHLRGYDGIDVALDPYPFGGSTATFEALWMGVPVVTLMGSTMMSRWSASILRAANLETLVARTPDAYVDIARRLAEDAEGRRTLRAGLRDTILRSPLCDGALRARQIERLYRALWRRRCREARA